MKGKKAVLRQPKSALNARIAYVPEDRGRLTGEVTRAEATEEKVMHLAALGTAERNGEK